MANDEGDGPGKKWGAVAGTIFSLLEIGILFLITILFFYIEDSVLLTQPPHFLIVTLEYVKGGFLIIESIFVVFSLVIALLLIIFRQPDTFDNAWDLFKKFRDESFFTVITMALMFGMAAIIGTINQYNNDESVPIEITIIIYALIAIFFISLVGFIVLVLASTYNSGKSRLVLLIAAKKNRGD